MENVQYHITAVGQMMLQENNPQRMSEDLRDDALWLSNAPEDMTLLLHMQKRVIEVSAILSQIVPNE